MTLQEAKNLIQSMKREKLLDFRDRLQLEATRARLVGKRCDGELLEFVQSVVDGKEPPVHHRYPVNKNGRCKVYAAQG